MDEFGRSLPPRAHAARRTSMALRALDYAKTRLAKPPRQGDMYEIPPKNAKNYFDPFGFLAPM